MAIQERKDIGKTLDSTGVDLGTAQKNGPYVLTATETASLLDSLTSPPKPLSSEVKRAIANYKRIKAERV